MTADVVHTTLTYPQAEELTERIRAKAQTIRDNLGALGALINRAQTGNAHEVLGYKSWTAYCSDVLGNRPALPRSERKEIVQFLHGEGMSTRAIAPIVGAHHDTVAQDLKDAGVGNPTPDQPGNVIGLDGKRYEQPKREPAPEPAPPAQTERRRPLPDSAREAGWGLRTAVDKVTRITEDDRFNANKAEMAPHLRSHLDYTIKVCQDLLDRINN